MVVLLGTHMGMDFSALGDIGTTLSQRKSFHIFGDVSSKVMDTSVLTKQNLEDLVDIWNFGVCEVWLSQYFGNVNV